LEFEAAQTSFEIAGRMPAAWVVAPSALCRTASLAKRRSLMVYRRGCGGRESGGAVFVAILNAQAVAAGRGVVDAYCRATRLDANR